MSKKLKLDVVDIKEGRKRADLYTKGVKHNFTNNPKPKKKKTSRSPVGSVVVHEFIKKPPTPNETVVFGIPTTGQIRFEWHAAFSSLVIPTNWSHGAHVVVSPLGYKVAEARNECVQAALDKGSDWLFFIDHDTLLPPDTCVKLRQYMLDGTKPVVSGLYYCKGSSPEPLVYRGTGNGPFYGWKHGDKFWVDGIPMGCALINMSLFRHMKPPWFITPRSIEYDEESKSLAKMGGTEDLYWCARVMDEGILEKAGYPELQKQKYPFWMDTSIFCQHIDLATGKQYPMHCGDQWLKNHDLYYERYMQRQEALEEYERKTRNRRSASN